MNTGLVFYLHYMQTSTAFGISLVLFVIFLLISSIKYVRKIAGSTVYFYFVSLIYFFLDVLLYVYQRDPAVALKVSVIQLSVVPFIVPAILCLNHNYLELKKTEKFYRIWFWLALGAAAVFAVLVVSTELIMERRINFHHAVLIQAAWGRYWFLVPGFLVFAYAIEFLRIFLLERRFPIFYWSGITLLLLGGLVSIMEGDFYRKVSLWFNYTTTFSLFSLLVGIKGALSYVRIHKLFEEERQREREQFQEMLKMLVKILEAKDPYTAGHSESVARYSMMIARKLGVFNEEQLKILETGALLHDIGKVGIPDEILRKPGSLSEEEWALIKKHPLIGAQILSISNSFHPYLPIVRGHHEKLNGSGYPYGLKGDKIDLMTRIVTVADIYDALTSDRPYRRAYDRKEALQILKGMASDKVDKTVVDALEAALEETELQECEQAS